MTPEDLKYIPEFSQAVDDAYASVLRDCAAYDPKVREEYYKSGISEALKTLAQALADARKELEQYRWRPIEEAPKDDDVLVLADGSVFRASLENSDWICGFLDVGEKAGLSLKLLNPPTHYMPLPKPPVGEV